MLNPTKHYECLRSALDLYRCDADYETLVDCVAHVLLDMQTWIGDAKSFFDAVRRSEELAIAQHEEVIRKLDGMLCDR